MPDLDRLQREFFRALQMPLRGSSRKSTELSATDEDHPPEFFRIADEMVKPGPWLTSAERLELYHRQYWFRILDSLAEDFPILRKMAGDGCFWDLVEAYLLERPPRSFTLRHLGEGFADFLAATPRLDAGRRPWFSSVARIEYAFMECFEAAQGALPEPADLAAGVIELQEHVKLLLLPVPADLCWDWPDFPSVDTAPAAPAWVAVWREPSGRAKQLRIDPAEAAILQRLRGGTRLDELFDSLPEPHPDEERVTAWFSAWQTNRWLGVRGKQGREELDPSAGWDGIDRMSSQSMAMD